MEKEQTPVAWLSSELERLSNHIGVNLSWSIVDSLVSQAKEKESLIIDNSFSIEFIKWYSGMEKEKILKAYERWNKEKTDLKLF